MQRLEVSGAVRPIYGSLGVKRLRTKPWVALSHCTRKWRNLLTATTVKHLFCRSFFHPL